MTERFARNETAQARLKRRHAAERRFRLYGLAAVGAAISILILLLVSIGAQAVSSFSRHDVVFDLTLEPDVVAPAGVENTETIAENVSGFYRLVRGNLAETFPRAATDTGTLSDLNGVITRLAVLPMARATAAAPERVGEAVTYRAALSDDLDLYLKRRSVDERLVRLSAISGAEQSERTGRVTLLLDDDGFQPVLGVLGAGGEAVLAPGGRSVLVEIGDLILRARAVSTETLTADVLTGTLEDVSALAGLPARVRVIATPETERNVSDAQIAFALSLQRDGRIKRVFNANLLGNADSTYPELAGTLAAIVGSLFVMLVTAGIAVPVGIAAAVYLEEFAPKTRMTDIIEVNINNLAAVPSIVFGLLGAAVFLNFFGFPRSAPLVGGLVLSLLTLPTVIIASRAALKAVPPSIRDAALGVGASRTQAVLHHVLPLAAPGIMTGAIIGLARALGETAPLLLIGMVAFVAEVPSGPTDEATALPVLIYKWSTGAERAWEPTTAAAIVILLVFMVAMNAVAVFLRRRFERRW